MTSGKQLTGPASYFEVEEEEEWEEEERGGLRREEKVEGG